MKSKSEGYLNMRNRCRELEIENLLKQGRIRELRSEIKRLRVEAEESEERIGALNDSIDQLQQTITARNESIKYWSDKAHNAKKQISEMIYKGEGETISKDTDTNAKKKDKDKSISIASEFTLKRAYEQGWLSGLDFSILIQNLLISESGYVVDTGDWKTVNAEVALRLAEKIKRHPMLWKWFFMVA